MSVANSLRALRDQGPLVHCLTNYVAMNISANVLLASGASPAMVHAIEEMDSFTPMCGAVSVNIGTLSAPWLESMKKAAQVANEKNIPWVLDPVAHFISDFRKTAAQDLLSLRPGIVRGNASEIMALAGETGSGKGVDSGDAVQDAQNAAKSIAQEFKTVVAVSGEVDFVTDGTQSAQTSGGDPMMPMVTALGCSQSSLMGAYAAVVPTFDAALAALAHYKIAGANAAKLAKGPGSFQMHFLDQLAAVEPDDLTAALL